ncbi:MAG: polysaccharide deacetylase family protein [Clostridia bacterium]|nr:polysaccharide deacetylase family protein [Clostridia bacterium]
MFNQFKRFIGMLLIVCTLIPLTSVGMAASDMPELTVNNYTVTLTNADNIKDIRYAIGEYTTVAEIKAAEGNVALSNKVVLNNTKDGVFTYNLPKAGYYTLWVRMQDGTNYFMPCDMTEIKAYVTTYGLNVTVHDMLDVKDFFIAKGRYNSYNEIKANGYIVRVTATKIGTKRDYTYIVPTDGMHTVLVRYNDGSELVFHEEITVDRPVFSGNGLQVTVSNIPDVKVIRTAYGEYDTPSEIKKAEDVRNFSAKSDIKGADSYTIQYRDEGLVSLIVQYNNGFTVSFKYNVTHLEPKVEYGEAHVSFSDLEGLYNIRYAKGEYSTSSEIKNAPGSQYIRPEAAVDGVITVNLEPGTYTFCVQYNDESYNYYVVTIKEPIPQASATGVKVSNAFSDNMILQRDEKLSVWGTADANSGQVVVELGGLYAVANVDPLGNWKAVFEETFAYTTEGQPLSVMSANDTIVFNDVLIGDVYYAVGQSNMFYSLGELAIDLKFAGLSHELVIDYDDNRDMRFFRVSNTDYTGMTGNMAQGTRTLYTDVYNGESWMMPSDIGKQMSTYASNMPSHQLYDRDAISKNVFSAIGYVFAYQMTENTDVPVGVIEIDASGHPLITFAPNELADKWGDDKLDSATGTYYYSMDTLSATHLKSRYAYNQQIYPLSNFSCAGIIWYQGESDWYNAREYHGRAADSFATQFTELMEYYRSTFGNDDFPVYIFEFAPCFSNNGANSYMDIGSAKVELGTIPQLLDNCHIVSNSDLWFNKGWINNIHPYIKHHNAARLTDIVLADKFGTKDINMVSGPVLESTEYGTTNVTLTFKNVGDRIKTCDGAEVRGIDIMVNTTGVYQWREAAGEVIVGSNKIVIDSTDQIFGVRYNRNTEYTYPNNLNLCNSHGMPAIAFVDYKVNPKMAGTESGIVRDGTPKKYFTLAFDDGITQDAKIMEILKKYDAEHSITFYINTGVLGLETDLSSLGVYGVQHKRWTLEELCSGVYKGFDVGVHTLHHPGLSSYDNNPAYQKLQIAGDAINIENITGYQPVGMAYPGGDHLVTRTTMKNILENTNIRYARGTTSTGKFDLPTNFMMWQPTCHLADTNLFTYANWFLKTNVPQDQLFYVWGHGYELDQFNYYDEFEKLIKMMAEADDVVLVTNAEFYQLFKNEIPSTY